MSRGMAWPAVGIVGAVRPLRQHSQPREAGAGGMTSAALGGWSKKDQRLKKHDGHWMDIVR